MKKERIKQLFKHHATAYYDCGCDAECCDCEPDRRMYLGNFTQAINQAELEWYKNLDVKLYNIIRFENQRYTHDAMVGYKKKIQNKIKELENDFKI